VVPYVIVKVHNDREFESTLLFETAHGKQLAMGSLGTQDLSHIARVIGIMTLDELITACKNAG
jgi:hypothetical protein